MPFLIQCFFFGKKKKIFSSSNDKHKNVYSPNKWSKSEFSEALFPIIGLHCCFPLIYCENLEIHDLPNEQFSIDYFMLIYCTLEFARLCIIAESF